MNWRSVPFIRLLLPLAAGIYLGDRLGAGLPVWGWVIIWWSIWGLLAVGHRRPLSFRRRVVFGGVLFWMWLLLGYWIVQRSDPRASLLHFVHDLDHSPALTGVVWEVAPRSRGWRILLSIRELEVKGRRRSATGKLLVYLPPGQPPRAGDGLRCQSPVVALNPPANPAAFDYARYMAVRGVFHAAYPREEALERIPAPDHGDWRWRARAWQEWGLAVLEKHLADPEVYAVAAALTLGYREALSEERRAAYQHTGAVHILAVSGLHVGLVHWILSMLLRVLPRIRHRRLIHSVSCLAGVWIFVAVTGLPPSAVRAGTMFSFFIIGRLLDRRSNSFNTLAASAFCLLLVQPQLLFDVGFQLSYAAVAGIIGLQSLLYRRLYLPHVLPDYTWKLLTVSVAAQMGTLPLSLHYFHQFPLYFWLSGLIAVPAAGFILGGGLTLLLLDGVPTAGAFCGRLLGAGIAALNAAIDWIGRLPGGHIDGIWLESAPVAGIYLCMLCLLLGRRLEARRFYLAVLVLLMLLVGYRTFRLLGTLQQRQVVVYRISGYTLVDLLNGRDCWSLADTGLTATAIGYAAGNYRLSRRLRSCRALPMAEAASLQVRWAGRSVLVIHPEQNLMSLPAGRVDIVVIRGDPAWSMTALRRRLRPGLLIFDTSNSPEKVSRWRHECRWLLQPFIDIRQQGGRIITLNTVKPENHVLQAE